MLKLTIKGNESFDESTNRFVKTEDVTIVLEHSLVSLSKWESIWEKPFLGPQEKSTEETLSYIQAMTITPNVPPEVYSRITQEDLELVNKLITAKMTATVIREESGSGRKEIITAEVIYHWMIAMQIPMECQYWHLNRLLTLIRVCNAKNAPKKKMSKSEIAAQNRALNAQRRAQIGSNG